MPFWHFCWCRGFCHRTESDLFLFLLKPKLRTFRNDCTKRQTFKKFVQNPPYRDQGPTAITGGEVNNIYHTVYTNRPDAACETNVPIISLSDHFPVCATRRTNNFERKRKHIEIQYREAFDENKFLTDLCKQNFNRVKFSDGPNEAFSQFYEIFFQVLNEHSKVKTKRVKSQIKPAWLTPEINEARHQRDHFHKIKDEENYRLWRNKVTSLIQSAKEQYYQKALDENESVSDIWRYIKEITPKQNNSVPNLLLAANLRSFSPGLVMIPVFELRTSLRTFFALPSLHFKPLDHHNN